jgi:adenylosuccinate lyase
MQRFIDGLELPESAKTSLRALLPATYTGNATQQARKI